MEVVTNPLEGEMSDCLHMMFSELRARRPPVHDADQWSGWIAAVRQVIQGLPTYDRRWACVGLLADDLAMAMGIPIAMGYRSLAGLLLAESDRQQVGR